MVAHPLPLVLRTAGSLVVLPFQSLHETAGKVYARCDRDFKRWFGGTIERPPERKVLDFHELLQWVLDDLVIEYLGGERLCQATLHDLLFLVHRIWVEGDTRFLTTDHPSVLYIPDDQKIVRAVGIFPTAESFEIRAHSLNGPFRWSAGAYFYTPPRSAA